MKANYKVILCIFSFIGSLYCQQQSSSLLQRYNLNDDKSVVIKLPKKLDEISGLALADSNSVYAHNDETGKIYKINLGTGEIENEFLIGKKKIKKDFEGIAVANGYIYLITSDGNLYKFKEPETKNKVKYRKIKTGLKQQNDIEGLCYDDENNSLLIACKGKAGKGYKGYKTVYSFNLDSLMLKEEPEYLISLNELKENYNIKNFSSSGIEKNPVSKTFFIISTHDKAIIELSPEGKILSAGKLNKKKHTQPEGITFLKNGSLIISDEAQNGTAKISIYHYLNIEN